MWHLVKKTARTRNTHTENDDVFGRQRKKETRRAVPSVWGRKQVRLQTDDCLQVGKQSWMKQATQLNSAWPSLRE